MVEIDVQLSPAGSFLASSTKIKGKIEVMKDGSIKAENIRIPVKSLVTGMDLRDRHLREKLGIKNDIKSTLLLVTAKGKDGSGKAIFKVLGKTQEALFKYSLVSKKYGTASFKLDLAKFGIKGINYMGVGVKESVDVSITMPLKYLK
ncbi:MAG: hypothetical protein ACJAT2_000739 [Bacteriovoracaceae bacterium]|jgi:hypothetical protein